MVRGIGRSGGNDERNLLAQLWQDTSGALLATEWLLLSTLLVIGLVPALVALRQGVQSEMVDASNATMKLDQSYHYTGTVVASNYDVNHRYVGTRNRVDRMDVVTSDGTLVPATLVPTNNGTWAVKSGNPTRLWLPIATTASSGFTDPLHIQGQREQKTVTLAPATTSDVKNDPATQDGK
jgi:hypothetical protein